MNLRLLVIFGLFCLMLSVATAQPPPPPHTCPLVKAIEKRMRNAEAYAIQNNDGMGPVQGLMGFKSARAFCLARNREYRLLDQLLKEAE